MACHGPGLTGGLQRNLLEGDWKYAKSDADLERVISEGVLEVATPPNKGILTAEQIELVADFIRAGRK